MHALSTRNDEASKASRPFSASRDGFVMGEGGGCLILEELEHAKARGAKIYAEVAGVGMSADAHHLTASHPEGLGAKLVMINALEDAEMDPKEVDYPKLEKEIAMKQHKRLPLALLLVFALCIQTLSFTSAAAALAVWSAQM